MSHFLHPSHKFKVVQVNCASFLDNMTDKIANIKVGFSVLGGRNPIEFTDERAYDMYAITHMSCKDTHTTSDGFEMSMDQYLAFSEGLETYFDTHIFSSVPSHLPELPDNMQWQLQQISLTQLSPNNSPDIAATDASLIPVFSGQLSVFSDVLNTILKKQPDEAFCLLYQAVAV